MLSAEDNAILSQTDAGTLMGDYFRRFWQPVALSEELPEPDGAPVRVTIMGEELVAFRNSEGDIGLISARCPHRGADLFYGRNEQCGLRCVYHGWKFDKDGNAVDLPNVDPEAGLHRTVKAKSYPTREYGDVVWAWMGPTDKVPTVPALEFGQLTASKRYVTKQLVECNWAQVMEGDLDPSHFSFLHMPAPSVPSDANPKAPADSRRLRYIRNDPRPRIEVMPHDAGFATGAARNTENEGAYWRILQYLVPAHGTGPSTLPGETYFGFTTVPITDHACWMYVYAWNPDQDIGDADREKYRKGHGIIAAVGPDYVPLLNNANEFRIDRNVQRNVSFTGISGFADQDIMVQQSQGLIADRTQENLTASDIAIVRFRHRVLAGAKALANGEEPSEPWCAEAYCTRPGSWFSAETNDFEAVMIQRFGNAQGRAPLANDTDSVR